MVLVDTSVWIDFFANRATTEVEHLTEALEAEETVCFTGVILQELLQGIRSPKQRHSLEESFLPFVELFPSRTTYRLAAELFRKSRAAGHPIRSSIDCLIAACCIEQGVKILEKDKDYTYIAEVSKLVRVRI
jgi:predicted nucleic acid-binding protein